MGMRMISHRHTDTFKEGRQASHGRLSVRRVRVVATAGVMALVPMVTGFPQVSSPARAHPVKSHVRQVALVKTSVAAMRTARDATMSRPRTPGAPDPITTARAGAVSPVQNVAGAVTVVGVTWPSGSVSAQSAQSARSQFQIRTRSGAAWSRWQQLDVEAGAADPAEARVARGGTNPYIITGATAYQVRSLTTDAQIPASATVQAVDPGTSGADSLQQAPGGAAAAAAAVTRPTIYTRAQWGADEGLRRTAPSYGKVMVGFVHHTDNANSYTARDVPAMIRGIYAYHVQTLGWSDVGYNFLVDRFGRIWEGRYGGMDKAVVGAQTLNFNSVSTGVSVIGNFQVAAAPQAATDALKRVLAWKLSLAGIPATGSVLANGKYLQRVSGHRDAYPTDCPGQYLYARLPEIRAGAAALMSAKPPPVVTPPARPWAVTRYTPYKALVLQQGSRGSAVVVLQRGLKVAADGDFGPMTRAALVAFERVQRLPVNGVANRVVWDRMERRDYPLIAYRGLTLRQGSSGPVVVVLQRAVRVSADGAFGPKTAAAVMVVQRSAKLAPTGVVSGWTWVAVENRMPR
jgi:peptidoglycan hydrolase-like protein with peptidoglycan-binding domain